MSILEVSDSGFRRAGREHRILAGSMHYFRVPDALWRDRLDGAVVAIGNAPTALFHLLERLREWPERPALVVGIPVGFIGAAESKEALAANDLGLPYLVVHGRRGGSAITCGALNALASSDE